MKTPSEKIHIPLSERLKSIPGFFGIRLSEEPHYRILEMEDDKEIRQYSPMTLATTKLIGSYEEVYDLAFKKLSQYIYGQNSTNKDMAMTTPLFMSQKLATWSMSFLLPAQFNSLTAPRPLDPDIFIQEWPSQTMAALWYSGAFDEKKRAAKSHDLVEWVNSHEDYRVSGDLRLALYDLPSTINFLRRNEVQVQVSEIH